MQPLYPADPHFGPLVCPAGNGKAPAPCEWDTFGAHDPSVVEADGWFYVFSTGAFGQNYYQIRRSRDFIHWEYVGQAFPRGLSSLREMTRELFAVYGKESKNDTLWAPDVVPAAGGGYWLYGCYTAKFGDNYSAIFLAHADSVAGEYTFARTLVLTGGDWGKQPNAIDPQIVYDAAGRMFMTYGSWHGGIRILELDPATGCRKDGFTYAQFCAGKITAAQYFGADLTGTSSAEGSVMAYHASVPVYGGDPFAAEEAANWQKRQGYLLTASCDDLARAYNMRCWASDLPNGGFTQPPYGRQGIKLASSFSWNYSAHDRRAPLDFFAAGHNDLFRTAAGDDLVVFHACSPCPEEKKPVPFYLCACLYAFNARGDMVMNPNRYAGERLRAVSEEELCALSGGEFDYIALPVRNDRCTFAQKGLRLCRGGAVTHRGKESGKWKLYGGHYLSFTLEGERYHGVVFPAWIEAERRAGLSVSARGEQSHLPFFMNMSWRQG